MKSYRNWWTVYGVCSGVLLLVTIWITITLLNLEARESRLSAVAAMQEDMRLALWRMDSGNDSLLSAESSRPFFHYRSFYPHQRAYTRLLEAFGPDDLLVPSPLLEHDSSVVLLHVQREAGGKWSSPQVPVGNLRDLAESNGIDGDAINARAELLSQIATSLEFVRGDSSGVASLPAPVAQTATMPLVDQFVGGHEASAEDHLTAIGTEPLGVAQLLVLQSLDDAVQRDDEASAVRSLQERQARGRWLDNNLALASKNQQGLYSTLATDVKDVEVTAFHAEWINRATATLMFTRNVTVGDTTHEQGFVVDFAVLAKQLLGDISDLFPTAQLRPVVPGHTLSDSDASRLLATLPVVLDTGRISMPVTAALTPMRLSLLMAWLAVLAVIVAVGLTLRSIITYAQRRTRFASAVTHELRTPLTTFQLYAELLDEGVVADEATRSEYHQTLRRESTRLGRLVENVLAYARLEDGRHVTQCASFGAKALVEQVLPALRDRATNVGMAFKGPDGAIDSEVALVTSPEVVEHILGNLVDNACKYGEPPVSLALRITASTIVLEIADTGPGVSAELADRIFEPFDRGSRQDGDPSAGVGLGLALSRELARDIGGTLTLRSGSPTTFQLALPR